MAYTKWKLLFYRSFSAALISLIVIFTIHYQLEINRNYLKPFRANGKKTSVVMKTCHFNNLAELIKAIEEDPTNACLARIRHLFDLQVKHVIVSFPETFAAKVLEWFGNDSKSLHNLQHQSLLHAYNKYTQTTTVYNPLRASRPLPKQPGNKDLKEFVQEYISSTMVKCDFCHYNDSTAMDTFGRLESKLAATASNSFKFHDLHSLVFPKRHSILDLNLDEFREIFALSHQWFYQVNAVYKGHTHPQIIFDALPHAGASQAHPHLHLFMGKSRKYDFWLTNIISSLLLAGEGHYLGQFRHLEHSVVKYQESKKRSYMADFVEAHLDIGLGVVFGNAAVIVPMDAHKENEFLIVSKKADNDWIEAFFTVYKAFVEELGVYCWSAGFAWPSVGGDDSLLPAVGRIGSRGNCQSAISDVSALELYAMFNVNSDPYATLQALKRSMVKYNGTVHI